MRDSFLKNLRVHGYTGGDRYYDVFQWVWKEKGYVVLLKDGFWKIIDPRKNETIYTKFSDNPFEDGVIKALWLAHLRDDDFYDLPLPDPKELQEESFCLMLCSGNMFLRQSAIDNTYYYLEYYSPLNVLCEFYYAKSLEGVIECIKKNCP